MTHNDWYANRFIPSSKKIETACTECGRKMWFPPSKARKYLRCGRECISSHGARLKETRRRDCLTCGKIFYPRPAQIKAGNGLFCSQACNTAGRVAMNSPEAQVRAVAKMRELRAAGLIKIRFGPEHHSWNGGPEAARRRMIESGKAAAIIRAYRKKYPDKVREFTLRRKSLKVGRLPRGTVSRIGKLQRWKCAICKKSIKQAFHVDHIMPLKRGGEHVPANIQLLCETCNVRKSSRHPMDYMRSLGRLL